MTKRKWGAGLGAIGKGMKAVGRRGRLPASPRPPDCPRELLRRVRALSARKVDYEDPAAEAAYYAAARPLIEDVLASSATCTPGFRMKAEAAEWAAGGEIVLGPDAASYERVVASLLQDLLATADDCAGCTRLPDG